MREERWSSVLMRERAEELKNETNKEKRRMEKYNHAGDDVKMMKNDKVENSWKKELTRNTERLKTFCRIYLTFCGMDFNTTESMLIYLRSKRIVILVHLNLCIWSKTCLEYLLTFYWFTSVCIIAIMSLQLVKPNVSSQFVQFGILCELRLLSHCM